MKKEEFIISVDDAGRRLDRVIRIFCKDKSLPQLYGAIRKGLIRVNGKKVSVGYKMLEGDVLSIASLLIESSGTPPQQADAVPENTWSGQLSIDNIPLLLQTDDLLIVNKPAGISVHGENSVSTVLEHAAPVQHRKGLSFRMGPLHRLDKHTSGIVCFSQSLTGAQWFSHALQERTLQKYYIGIAEGKMQDGLIQTRVGQAELITRCYRLEYNVQEKVSCVLFQLITGKKHQIRKHAQHCSHPLVGDRRYGSKRSLTGCSHYVLHAWRLYFPKKRLTGLPACIEAPLSPKMEKVLMSLFPQCYDRMDTIIHEIQGKS